MEDVIPIIVKMEQQNLRTSISMGRTDVSLSQAGFINYITSTDLNGPLNKKFTERVYQDMTQPLKYGYIVLKMIDDDVLFLVVIIFLRRIILIC